MLPPLAASHENCRLVRDSGDQQWWCRKSTATLSARVSCPVERCCCSKAASRCHRVACHCGPCAAISCRHLPRVRRCRHCSLSGQLASP
eukprot:228816-Rhodomonas_salina.1